MEDKLVWLPGTTSNGLDAQTAVKLLNKVGNHLCCVVRQENDAIDDLGFDIELRPTVWRRPTHEVREMCDVCCTTIFNFHLLCDKCGFSVCIDCVKTRERLGKKVHFQLLPLTFIFLYHNTNRL